MAGKRKKFLRKADMTREFLDATIDETKIPHREILNYVERRTHPYMETMPKGAIMLRFAQRTVDKRASITGFADRSIRIGSEEFRETLVEPFHIKNKRMFGPGDLGYSLTGDNQPQLDGVESVRATNALEMRRLNLVTEGFVAMVSASTFTYMDADTAAESNILIVIDYSEDISAIPDAGSYGGSTGDFSSATVKTLFEFRKAKAAYRGADNIDFPFNLAFINDATAGQMLQNAEIKAKYTPLQPSDPDNTGETYDGFVYDGVTFIVWHKQYVTADGTLADAIGDGYAVVTVAEDPVTGGAPMVWHSAENILNRMDASGPFFDALEEGDEPREIGVRLYDNGVPAPARKNLIRRWKLY